MGRISKQPALPEKKVCMENKVYAKNNIEECFNSYCSSIFAQDDSEVVFPLHQSSKKFIDDIRINKEAPSEENKNICSGANSFDGTSPKFKISALPFISNHLHPIAVLATLSFPGWGEKYIYALISKTQSI